MEKGAVFERATCCLIGERTVQNYDSHQNVLIRLFWCCFFLLRFREASLSLQMASHSILTIAVVWPGCF